MAVEARKMNFFPSQIFSDRDLMKNHPAATMNPYNTRMDFAHPLYSPMPDQLLPYYQQQLANDRNTSMNKTESGVTYNNINIGSRKRARDSNNDYEAYNSTASQKQRFPGDLDVLFQLQQQQSDLNSLIAEHTEKIRFELEERRKMQLRTIITTAQEEVMKKMKEKEEEIQGMGKLNWVLQERVKSLYVENQIWRDLAQTNEATANSLRTNLEQVLAHVSTEDNNNHHRHVSGGGGDTADDAESSCGSSDHGREKGKEGVWQSRRSSPAVDGGAVSGAMCKKCGERESSVLLLPCRHLCMCTMCGSTLVGNCPVCDSVMNASIHVNMS
ncbi:BOI-related E3 ubiquitin-protein ligase 1-like [Rutidosis leptorrhynchoides]|uniref:BOI-related E3 ubiquitin-protein ligase 1-like n=1 Tax=Rutidosis leptorrhynchoides TaxID=125765 RepID=UPI003A999296